MWTGIAWFVAGFVAFPVSILVMFTTFQVVIDWIYRPEVRPNPLDNPKMRERYGLPPK